MSVRKFYGFYLECPFKVTNDPDEINVVLLKHYVFFLRDCAMMY